MIKIPEEHVQHKLCDELEERHGALSRRYDASNRERLATAAHGIHAWLSSLDDDNIAVARDMTLGDFANAYALAAGGLRTFEKSRDKALRAAVEAAAIEIAPGVRVNPGLGGQHPLLREGDNE